MRAAELRLRWDLLTAAALAVVLLGGCRPTEPERVLTLATTTSTRDSGLLDELLPEFERSTGIDVRVVAVGSGQALSLGRRGDADVLLTHAQDGERALVADGYAREALPVMYNEFLLVGPEADPAGLGVATDVLDAMRRIREHNAVFVSRGDDSGTHRRELSLWNEAGVDPDFSAYHSAGAGMANALRVASELQGYVLTDIGTWLAHRKRLELREAVRGDALLANPYSVLVISSDRNPGVREDGARRFADFLLRDETQSAIRTFGTDRFGQPLFHTYEEARPLRSAGQP